MQDDIDYHGDFEVTALKLAHRSARALERIRDLLEGAYDDRCVQMDMDAEVAETLIRIADAVARPERDD